MREKLLISGLGHTWILDLDGTIVKHNGYMTEHGDEFIGGALDFLNSIPENDMIIILTSRKEEYRDRTISFLKKNNVKYDYILFGCPYGERVLVNDAKESGLKTVASILLKRNEGNYPEIVIDNGL